LLLAIFPSRLQNAPVRVVAQCTSAQLAVKLISVHNFLETGRLGENLKGLTSG